MGIYLVSKFVLEGYMEVLCMEVGPLGIHVSMTEAGFLKTPMADHRLIAAAQLEEYDPFRQRALRAVRAHEEKAPGPEVVSQTILRIIASKKPRLRYLIGQQAKVTKRLQRFLPEWAYERGKRSTFGLG